MKLEGTILPHDFSNRSSSTPAAERAELVRCGGSRLSTQCLDCGCNSFWVWCALAPFLPKFTSSTERSDARKLQLYPLNRRDSSLEFQNVYTRRKLPTSTSRSKCRSTIPGNYPPFTSKPNSMLMVKAYSVKLALDRNIRCPSATAHLTWRMPIFPLSSLGRFSWGQ